MNSKEEIFARLRQMMSTMFELDVEKVLPEANLFKDLNLDSIDAIDMLVELEDTTKISIDPEQFKEVRTVQDVVDVIYSLQA